MYTPEGAIFAGNVLLDVYDSVTGLLTGERDVGNTRNLTFDPPSFEKKEKIGKRLENYGQVIESVITKQTQALKFTLDDINKENLVLQMFGESALVNVTAGSVTDETVIAYLDKYTKLSKKRIKSSPAMVVKAVTPDDWADTDYELGDFVLAGTMRAECTTAGNAGSTEPTWAGHSVGDTITDGTVTWTLRKLTYDLGVDYEVSATPGMIKPLSTGSIEEGQTLKVSFSFNAYTGYRVNANKVTAIYAQLRLIGKNTVNNDDVEVIVYRVSLTPTGGMDWITDEFAVLDFTGDILAVDAGTWDVEVLAA